MPDRKSDAELSAAARRALGSLLDDSPRVSHADALGTLNALLERLSTEQPKGWRAMCDGVELAKVVLAPLYLPAEDIQPFPVRSKPEVA